MAKKRKNDMQPADNMYMKCEDSAEELKRKEIFEMNEIILKNANVDDFIHIEHIDAPIRMFEYEDHVFKNEHEFVYTMCSKVVSAELHSETISATSEQIKELVRNHGTNVVELTKSTLMDESSRSINRYVLNNIKKLSDVSYKKTFTRYDRIVEFIFRLFKKEYQKKTIVNSKKDLLKKILLESFDISKETKKGPGTYVICNSRVAMNLQDRYSFAPVEKNDKIKTCCGSFLVGKYANLTIFVDPYMSFNDNSIYIGRIVSKTETGLGMAIYDEGTAIKTVASMAENFEEKQKTMLVMRYSTFEKGLHPEANFRKIIFKIKDKTWS